MQRVIYKHNRERISAIKFDSLKGFESLIKETSCNKGDLIWVKDVMGWPIGFVFRYFPLEKNFEPKVDMFLVSPSEELVEALEDLSDSYERFCGYYDESRNEYTISLYNSVRNLSEKEIIKILSRISEDLCRAYDFGNESYG